MLDLDAHWSSDEARWLRRSAAFMSAIKKGEFSETLIAYHPGVTTMWLSGLRIFFTDPGLNVENLALARWFIGVTVWVGIAVTCLFIYRLFGEWVALAGVVCLAYSPLFLAQTRRVHTDALATTFILLTVLGFLLYCQNQQHLRYLIFSGIAYGLALLSKSYALILLPWLPLCLFLFREKHSGAFRIYLARGICFLNCAALTVLALWPVFWTPPFGIIVICLLGITFILFLGMKKERCPIVLLLTGLAGLILVCVRETHPAWTVLEKVNWAVTTPHEVEHFFLGNVVNDPGWLFYPFALTIKSTPLMLPLVLVGCFLLWKQWKGSEGTSSQFRMVLALLAGVVLFILCLSATRKKFFRYLLPTFVLLEILSAIVFVELLRWGCKHLESKFRAKALALKNAFLALACLLLFLIQILPVLTLHPYYGTYYNLCWKGTDITKIITFGDASGIDIAANYLNQKSIDKPLRVQVSPLMTSSFLRYFTGFVKPVGLMEGVPVDYEVVYIRDSQIGYVPQTGALKGELEAIITLNGIDHVWIYRIPTEETP